MKKNRSNQKLNFISFCQKIYLHLLSYYLDNSVIIRYLLNEQKININYCYSVSYRVIRKWYLNFFIQVNELKIKVEEETLFYS